MTEIQRVLLKVVLGVVLVGAACGGSEMRTYSLPASHPIQTAIADKPIEHCLITLRIWNGNDVNATVDSGYVCLKTAEGQFSVPNEIFLHTPKGDEVGGICLGDTSESVRVSSAEKSRTQPKQCVWNGYFDDNYPFNFRIETWADAEAPKRPISTYVTAIRSFRNGALVLKWLSTQAPKTTTLTIAGTQLRGAHLPHFSPIDLRFIPNGVEVSAAIRDEEIAKKMAHGFTGRLVLGARGLSADEHLALDNLPLGAAYECLRHQIDSLKYSADRLGGGKRKLKDPGAAPVDCASLQPQTGSLLESYDDFKNRKISDLAELTTELDAKLDSLAANHPVLGATKAKLDEKLTEWVNEMEAKINLKPSSNEMPDGRSKREAENKRLRKLIESVTDKVVATDQLIVDAFKLTDALYELPARIKEKAVNIANDDGAQAHLFASFATELESEGSQFVARASNPALVEGEQSVDMEYADQGQSYFLSPWSALAIQVSGDGQGTEFDIESVLPVVDLVGVRYQTGKSRWGDWRFGVGGMFYPDKVSEIDPESMEEEKVDVMNFAVVGSMSLAWIRVGMGWTLDKQGFDSDFYRFDDPDRFRIIVGVDLIRMVTGEPLGISGETN